MTASKIGKLEEISRYVKNGSSVALGGAWLCNHPMAAVREIIRQGIKDLTVYTIVGSTDIDLLLAAGSIRKLVFSFVSLEAFGLAPNFRRAVENRLIEVQEVSGLALITGFEAAGRNVPFLPYGGPSGSDYLKVSPEIYKTVTCPFTGQETIAVPAISPDVAIIHGARADELGNVQFDGTSGSDWDLAKAAKKVIVTVEEIVSGEVIRQNPDKTKVPRFYVDLVIHAPMGAHPTSSVPHYVADGLHMLDYAKAAAKPETVAQYIQQVVMGGEAAYLEAVGGTEKIEKLKRLAKKVVLL